MTKPTIKQLQAVQKRYGLIKHPLAGKLNAPKPKPEGDGLLGGFSAEDWKKPDMLSPILSQPRAALVIALEYMCRNPADDFPEVSEVLFSGIQSLTFLIGDNYAVPADVFPKDFLDYVEFRGKSFPT